MKKYLLLTDTHLSDSNIDLVTDIFRQAILVCKERNINNIFHLGDWFTSRKSQSLAVLKATEYIIELFEVNGIICDIFKGNHDAVESDTTDSYIDIFDNPNFIVHYVERRLILGDINMYLLPYFKESGSYLERLNSFYPLPKKGVNILLTHIAVNGVKNNDGTQVENELQLDKFKGFDKVISGHYHNYSEVGSNVIYMGSAYQANYGEDDKKGFTILSEDGSLEFIQSTFPKFIKLKVDISDIKQIKQIQKDYGNPTKDNVRIVFTGDETQLASLNKEKFNSIGIDVKFDKEVIRQDLTGILETRDYGTGYDRSDILKAFNHFCELNEYIDKEVGLKYLKQLEA